MKGTTIGCYRENRALRRPTSTGENDMTILIDKPELKDGEIYVGAIISADGSRNHHIILMPDSQISIKWKDAMAWAHSIGGELPDRVESALLFAHAKEHFDQEAYWTREKHAALSYYAWYQNFYYGVQNYYYTTTKLRARAVRRLAI
jgi:hypothetical protein